MAHYVFECKAYPEFSFNVNQLKRNPKEESKVVRFHQGILDTKFQELSEEEADAVYQALSRLRQRPGWETDIKVLTKVEEKEQSHAKQRV